MRTEELIGRLAGDLRPVRRMASPGWQAAAWLGFAVASIGVAVALHGIRHDLPSRMALPYEVGQWLASLAVGVTAALSAAMLARPDRSWRWALVPMVPLLFWLGTLGWGCLADFARLGEGALQPRTSWRCLGFVVSLGLPLTAVLLVLLRHAGPVRPVPVLLLAGLASAALCSAGLSLFHELDAALEVLIWHGGSVVIVALLGRMVGWPLLRRPPAVPG